MVPFPPTSSWTRSYQQSIFTTCRAAGDKPYFPENKQDFDSSISTVVPYFSLLIHKHATISKCRLKSISIILDATHQPKRGD
jgi:hypothetical protein